MLKKTMLATLAASALLGATAPRAASAQGAPGGWHHEPLFAGVTLSDTQQQKIADLHRAGWQNSRPLFDQLRAIDGKIDDALLGSGSVNEASLAALVQQKATIRTQLDAARLSERIAERNLLSADQIAAASSTHARLASLHAQERALRTGPAAGNTVAAAASPPAEAE